MLPDAVMQGMGWAQPPPVEDALAGAPPPDASGLDPAVLQGLGIAPPSVAPPPPLPSMATPPPPAPTGASAPTSPSRGDYNVPATAINGPGAPVPAAPPKPVRPATPDQLAVQAQSKQVAADQQSAKAIAEQQAVSQEKAQADVAAFRQHEARAKEIEDERKVLQDDITKTRATKQAYVDSTLREVDNYKIDQNKFMKEAGVAGIIGWGIAAALSGIGDSLQRKSGPNPVIQMLQDRMKQAVVAQMDERDQLKQKVGRAEHALDKFDAFSKDRSAQIDLLGARNDKWLAGQIAMTAAKMADPQARATAQKEYAALMESSAAKAESAAEKAASIDIQKRQLGVAQFQASESARHNKAMEGLTAQQRDIEAAKALKAGQADQAKLIRERALGGDVVEVKNPDGTVTKKTDLIRLRNGDVFIPQGTETNVTKLQEQHKASMLLLGTIDEILRLGPEWLSDTAKSDKKQRLDELIAAAKLQAIAANNLGVPTGKDVELATGVIGSNDPTQLRSTLAGLQQGRATVVRNHNIELKSFGLDRPWEPEDNSRPPPAPVKTDPDKMLAVALGDRGDDPGAVVDAAGKLQPKIPGMYSVDIDAPQAVKPSEQDKRVSKEFPKMGAGQRAVLETFAAWARSDDAMLRKRGLDFLEKSANDGDEQGVRDYAQSLLQNVVQPAPPLPEETTTTSSGPGRATGGRSTIDSLTPQDSALRLRGP